MTCLSNIAIKQNKEKIEKSYIPVAVATDSL